MRLSSLVLGALIATSPLHAQQRPDVAVRKAAMQKLAFIAGNWSGDATVKAGPGEPLKIRQSEDVRYRLDGLLLLIEGTGRDASGKVVFNALATISFDDTSKTYRIRAHRDGHYIDAELKLMEKGFEWGFPTGPMTIRNRMKLEDSGEWREVTDAITADGREFRSVEMLVRREK